MKQISNSLHADIIKLLSLMENEITSDTIMRANLLRKIKIAKRKLNKNRGR